MDKTLQDLAWSVLPKEFKEEVKKLYIETEIELSKKKGATDNLTQQLRGMNRQLAYLFDHHNLTSDAEEEEVLTISRSKVIDIFTQNTILLSEGHTEYLSGFYNGKCHVLKDLFGSKCLPDEDTSKEPKPAEPTLTDSAPTFTDKCKRQDAAKSEKTASETPESEKILQNQPSDADCASTSDHFADAGKMIPARLQIAAMIMQGALANPNVIRSCSDYENEAEYIANMALYYADTLINESNKTDNQ